MYVNAGVPGQCLQPNTEVAAASRQREGRWRGRARSVRASTGAAVPAGLPQGSSMESAGSSGLIWRGIQLVWHISSVQPLMTSREVSLRRYSACAAGGTARTISVVTGMRCR